MTPKRSSQIRKKRRRQTPEPPQPIRLRSEIIKLLPIEMQRHSVAYIDTQSPEQKIATGTLVTIDGRLLVATASHTIPKDPGCRLCFVGNTEQPTEPNLEVLGWAKQRAKGLSEPYPDVGFIELRPDAAERLGREPLSLYRLHLFGPGRVGPACYVLGYPADEVQQQVIGKKVMLWRVQLVIYTNKPLEPANWPLVPESAHKPRRSVDIFVPYPIGEDELFQFSWQEKQSWNEPVGMSGGGLWQARDYGGALRRRYVN
ncbi:MAG TPA: hypothetical protein VFE62_02690 [Gemmataceae bacterium]|nr:hypothetical protein [Pirellulales bacterium]HZZ77395.1 hypothetical protein [Gemmataceae bacterium]